MWISRIKQIKIKFRILLDPYMGSARDGPRSSDAPERLPPYPVNDDFMLYTPFSWFKMKSGEAEKYTSKKVWVRRINTGVWCVCSTGNTFNITERLLNPAYFLLAPNKIHLKFCIKLIFQCRKKTSFFPLSLWKRENSGDGKPASCKPCFHQPEWEALGCNPMYKMSWGGSPIEHHVTYFWVDLHRIVLFIPNPHSSGELTAQSYPEISGSKQHWL